MEAPGTRAALSRDMADAPAQEAKKSGSSGKLMLILMLVNVLAVAGIGAYVLLFQNTKATADNPKKDGEEGEEGEKKKETKPKFGPLVELMPIVANLNDPSAGRYVKVSMQLETKDDAAKAAVEEAMVPVRDKLLIIFSGLSVNDTIGAELKNEVREHTKKQLNQLLGRELVRNVYFTEFVVQ